MTTRIACDFRGIAARSGADFPRVVPGLVAAREIHARRSAASFLLALDDSVLATFGCERRGVEETGRRPFPL